MVIERPSKRRPPIASGMKRNMRFNGVEASLASSAAPVVESAYDPSLDVGLFFRMSGPATDAGGGAASQVNDSTAGARHVTFASGQRPTIVATDATANNRRTYLFGASHRGSVGGVAADWVRLHNTTTQRIWIVFKPDANATTRNGPLLHSSGATLNTASTTGFTVQYDGTRETLDVAFYRGSAPILAVVGGATSECARNAWHILVIEKNASSFSAYLDGSKILDGDWAGAPSSSNPATVPLIGGEGTLGSFRGWIAEVGVTTTSTAVAITDYLRAYYAVAAVRSPNRRVCYEDGVALSSLFPNIPSVRSYFTKSTSTPNATQVVARVADFTKLLTARARTGGEYSCDVDFSTKQNQPAWIELSSGAPVNGSVAPGKVRKLFLVIGESGMVGYGSESSLPVGYPPADTSVWVFDREAKWTAPLDEPVYGNLLYPLDDFTPDGDPTDSILWPGPSVGVGPVGMTGWRIQQGLGPSYEVGLVMSPDGGTTSANWNFGKSDIGNLCGYALYKLRIAMKMPNTVLAGVLCDQGINDTWAGGGSNWLTNWTAIMAYIRSTLNDPNLPLFYTHLGTGIVPTDIPRPDWGAVNTDQVAFQSSVNIMLNRPETEPGTDRSNGTPYVQGGAIGDVHFGTVGNNYLSQYFAAAVLAHPYP
jgi:hypothetical protein